MTNGEMWLQEIYREAFSHCKLKVGDWVKVNKVLGKDGKQFGWYKEIQGPSRLDHTGKIIEKTDDSYVVQFEDDALELPYFVLEKADSPGMYKFKPFDHVLGRDDDDDIWHPDIFLYLYRSPHIEVSYEFYCARNRWKECIPYEGNEQLANTKGIKEEEE